MIRIKYVCMALMASVLAVATANPAEARKLIPGTYQMNWMLPDPNGEQYQTDVPLARIKPEDLGQYTPLISDRPLVGLLGPFRLVVDESGGTNKGYNTVYLIPTLQDTGPFDLKKAACVWLGGTGRIRSWDYGGGLSADAEMTFCKPVLKVSQVLNSVELDSDSPAAGTAASYCVRVVLWSDWRGTIKSDEGDMAVEYQMGVPYDPHGTRPLKESYSPLSIDMLTIRKAGEQNTDESGDMLFVGKPPTLYRQHLYTFKFSKTCDSVSVIPYTGKTGTVVCKVTSGDGKPLAIQAAGVGSKSTGSGFMDYGGSLLVVPGVYDSATIAVPWKGSGSPLTDHLAFDLSRPVNVAAGSVKPIATGGPLAIEIEPKSKEITVTAGKNKTISVAVVTAGDHDLVRTPLGPCRPLVTIKDMSGKVVAQGLADSRVGYTIKTTEEWKPGTYRIVATFDAKPYQTKPIVAAKVLKVLPHGSAAPAGASVYPESLPAASGDGDGLGIWLGGATIKPVPEKKNAPDAGLPARSSTNAPIPKSITATPAGRQRRQSLDEFKYAEQAADGATRVYGTIHGPVTWTKSKSPYLVADNLYVADDGALTIEPGVVVNVARPNDGANTSNFDRVAIEVHGLLTARGTPTDMILFTSASPNPRVASEWDGINFFSTEPSVLTWSVIEYAGFGVDLYTTGLVAHNVFRKCHTGIYMENGFMGDVRHNVSTLNMYSGIRGNATGPFAAALDNICYRNGDGIDFWNGAIAYADYNLYWSVSRGSQGNMANYSAGAIPGPHDVVADPKFASQAELDFRLASDSPAKGAASDGGDIGLDIESWSDAAAQNEIDAWLAGGARELWTAAAVAGRRRPGSPLDSYEQALRVTQDHELWAKILCSIGAETMSTNNETALVRLNKAMKLTTNPATRDTIRKLIAEAEMIAGKPEEAVKTVNAVEWPQSKIWTEPALARYTVAAGDLTAGATHLDNLKKSDPEEFVGAVSSAISQAVSAGKLDVAIDLVSKFDPYPAAEEAFTARLTLAKALRSNGQFEKAVEILRISDKVDPFNRQAAESLALLAQILGNDLGRKDEAKAVWTKLAAGYYPTDPNVVRAKDELGKDAPQTPRNKLVLIDESDFKCSIYDRSLGSSCNFSMFAAIKALTSHGLTVHSNGGHGDTRLDLDTMGQYGLIIMNGRYGGDSEPPMPAEEIENVVDYVTNGGCLMVSSGGGELGAGREPQFFNGLLARFGLSFKENTRLAESERMGRAADIPFMAGLNGFDAEYGVPVGFDKGQVLALCGNKPVVVVKQFGEGKVMAAGVGLCFLGALLEDWGGRERPTTEKNRAFLFRLVDYCLQGAR